MCDNTEDLNEFITIMLLDVMIPLIKDINKFMDTVILNSGYLNNIIDYLNTLSATTSQAINDVLLGLSKIGLLSDEYDILNLFLYNTFICDINRINVHTNSIVCSRPASHRFYEIT